MTTTVPSEITIGDQEGGGNSNSNMSNSDTSSSSNSPDMSSPIDLCPLVEPPLPIELLYNATVLALLACNAVFLVLIMMVRNGC